LAESVQIPIIKNAIRGHFQFSNGNRSMRKTYLLGVDLGTTATKAALYDRNGRFVSEGLAEVPLYHPKPGCVEQENEDFYDSAVEAVRKCLEACSVNPRAIAGISFDSQMAGIGTIDDYFKPATKFDSWLDMRCQPYIDEMDRLYGDLITSLTGCPPTCNHGPKILWWMREKPDTYRKITKFVTPVCYVAGKMAGLRPDEAFIDPTFLHFTALSDHETGNWSPELCRLLGVDICRLPRVVESWKVIGEVQPFPAKDFGLAAGTPIAAGAGDTAAGALGAGIIKEGMLLDTAGTASVISCCTQHFVADRDHRALLVMRSVIPGLWMPLGYIAGGGLALRWFRDNFYPNGSPESRDKDAAYQDLVDMAMQAPPGCDGLQFCPHLGGRICPSVPEMRGAWYGFSWGHTKAHFARAILESVAFDYAYLLGILRGLLPDLELEEARVIGGGARSPSWSQIKADVLGVPYQRVGRSESATWGSALIAGYATGVIHDLGEHAANTASCGGPRLEPRPDHTALYKEAVRHYVGWMERLKEGFQHYVR
jgi:xylulokinase